MNREEVFHYSGFNCKVSSKQNFGQEDSSQERPPSREFVSKEWDFFKLRIFSILFASQSLVYDVIDIMIDEFSIQSSTEQHKVLYFYAFMGTSSDLISSSDGQTIQIAHHFERLQF